MVRWRQTHELGSQSGTPKPSTRYLLSHKLDIERRPYPFLSFPFPPELPRTPSLLIHDCDCPGQAIPISPVQAASSRTTNSSGYLLTSAQFPGLPAMPLGRLATQNRLSDCKYHTLRQMGPDSPKTTCKPKLGRRTPNERRL